METSEPFQQRMSERKVFEIVIDMIIDVINKEFSDNGEARLRIYELIADNLHGMVQVLRSPSINTDLSHIQGLITDGSLIEEG